MFMCFKISTRKTDCLNGYSYLANPCLWIGDPCHLSVSLLILFCEWEMGGYFMVKSFTFMLMLDLGCFLILPFLN